MSLLQIYQKKLFQNFLLINLNLSKLQVTRIFLLWCCATGHSVWLLLLCTSLVLKLYVWNWIKWLTTEIHAKQLSLNSAWTENLKNISKIWTFKFFYKLPFILQQKKLLCCPMVIMMALDIIVLPNIGFLRIPYTDFLSIHHQALYCTELVMTFMATAFFVYLFLLAYAKFTSESSGQISIAQVNSEPKVRSWIRWFWKILSLQILIIQNKKIEFFFENINFIFKF